MSLCNFVRRFKHASGKARAFTCRNCALPQPKHLLERGHRTMQEISGAVGHQDVAFFARSFTRHTGVWPSAYRQKFGM